MREQLPGFLDDPRDNFSYARHHWHRHWGTYTDAIILDTPSRDVLTTAKAITTRGDLAIGVSNTLTAVLESVGPNFDRANIERRWLPTTLTTNALFKGHGSSVTSVLIGFDDRMVERTQIHQAIPTADIVRIAGGHRYTGKQATPLDLNALQHMLATEAGRADAFAVTANYVSRNPEYEQRANRLIREHTGRPVTASSELTDALNGPRRALTATFNARIVSLERAVRSTMISLGIDAPIMIVLGNGALTNAQSVLEKLIQTISSGPAASVIGARFLSGLEDIIVSDIGGTTTEIATVRDGWPQLDPKGANVGGFRTLARAIDMATIGFGGDNEVQFDTAGGLKLASNRVVPITLLETHHRQVAAALAFALTRNSGTLSPRNMVQSYALGSTGGFSKLAQNATRCVLRKKRIGCGRNQKRTAALDAQSAGARPRQGVHPLLGAVVQGQLQLGGLDIRLAPSLPVVAVSGPAPTFYPEIGQRLDIECIIPTHSNVANAIGAAVGVIKARAVVEITYSEDGSYIVHGLHGPVVVASAVVALERATALARDLAEREAKQMGAADGNVRVDIKRIELPNMSSKLSLMAVTVTADCVEPPVVH